MNDKLVLVARILLGAIYVVFGLNGFLQFIPAPPMNQPSMNFIMALFATGYMFPLIKVTEIVGGLLLLLGKKVPLALVILAPITLNILLFHVFLAGDLLMAVAMSVFHIVLFMANKDKLQSLLD